MDEKHISWLNAINFEEPLLKETLNEYLIEYFNLVDRIEKLDSRISEIAGEKEYADKVKRLTCFIGIKEHTALSLIVETGDFTRFAKGNTYGAWLGMTPIQNASSDVDNRFGITKSGNRHLRLLLVEAAQAYTRGAIGYKSKALKQRQEGCSSEIIAYADRANVRLRKKYYHMIKNGKKHNVIKVAIARELSCFIWEMMTDHISIA